MEISSHHWDLRWKARYKYSNYDGKGGAKCPQLLCAEERNIHTRIDQAPGKGGGDILLLE